MPKIITDASKELPIQCISEEILRLEDQSSRRTSAMCTGCHCVFVVFTDTLLLAVRRGGVGLAWERFR